MSKKSLEIAHQLSKYYTFPLMILPAVPECIIDGEGDWVLKARNQTTAISICNLLNSLHAHKELVND